MSEFRTDRPIYRQIVDYACALILKGQWLPGEKIPSVRELAVGMGVNSHTVLKAFDELQQQGLITPRRGMGFFLADNAPRLVQQKNRQEFFVDTMPDIFSRMASLGITIDEIVGEYREWEHKVKSL